MNKVKKKISNPKEWRFDFQQGYTASRLTFEPSRPPIPWVKRVLSSEVKCPGLEDDTLPSDTDAKTLKIIPPISPHILTACCCHV
jgi:hypothetical protein